MTADLARPLRSREGAATPPRLTAWAQTAVLVAFCFVQDPRWIVPDTKLDLTVSPDGLLGRALTLWDPLGAAGQLQNQAYGYLFPVGPFFWLGGLLDLPAWVIQRLWWALLLVVAFHGVRLLLQRLEIGTVGSRAIASFAYALAPRMLEGLGAVSSEIWPMALAPWVLLPLVSVAPGTERRAAARSAVAVLAVGAVNAVATLAVLVPAAWWLVTRARGQRGELAAWWLGMIALASLWWTVPLVLLGRYSPPFLDWIESSDVTTSGAALTEALRGTTQWIAAITSARGPQWPAGWQILTSVPTVGLGLALASLGLLGLWRPRRGWALFARGGLVIGLVLVTLGHIAPVAGPQSSTLATLLDGPLAPFRNTHKFEPIVRITLCLGLAHALPHLRELLRRLGSPVPALASGIAVLAVIAQAAAPAFIGVSQEGRYLGLPTYWSDAASWLAANPTAGRTLVVPGATSPASYWGDPRDEPLQALARNPWIVRDAVPLGSAGATRLLNDVETRIASGYGGTELSNDLVRLGVSRVLLRADLNYRLTGAPAPVVVRAALRSAGATEVMSFGPPVGSPKDPTLLVDGGQDQPAPSIAVFDLTASTAIAPSRVTASSDLLTIAGGPEGTALLPDATRGSILSSDWQSRRAMGLTNSPEILTDTLQRRSANFASVRGNYGPTLGADQPYPAKRRVHDWLMPWLPEGAELTRFQTVEELSGAQTVRASSSLAYPGLGQTRDLTRVPTSAFDGSGDTMWESSGQSAEGQFIEVTWAKPVNVPESITAVFDMDRGVDVAAVTLASDRGSRRTGVSSPEIIGAKADRYAVALDAPPGKTTRLRLTITEVRDGKPTVRLRDLGAAQIPRVESWLRLPEPTSSKVEAIILQSSPSRVPSCVPDDAGIVRCLPEAARVGEGEADLRRVFTLPQPGAYTVTGTVWPRDETASRHLLERADRIRVDASSTWLDGPAVAPELIVDNDPTTYWASAPDERQPSIQLNFGSRRQVRGLRVTTSDDVSGRRASRVRVAIGNQTYDRPVLEDGTVALPALRTRSVTITILETTPATMRNGISTVGAPVVIGDVSLIGDPWPTMPTPLIQVPCGFGPRLQINGTEYATRVSGTRADFVRGRPLEMAVCDTVRLGKGMQRLRVLASAEFSPRTLTLMSQTGVLGGQKKGDSAVRVDDWGPTHRQASVVAGNATPGLLSVRENANPGWSARHAGRLLPAVTLDGWSQAWVLPTRATGSVTLEFEPQRQYVVALLVGALGALLTLLFAIGSRRGAPRPLPERTVRPITGVLFWVGGLVLLGGAWGLLLGAAVYALRRLTRAFAGTRVSLASAGGVVLATLLFAWTVWSSVAPWPAPMASNRGPIAQILALGILALVLAPDGREHPALSERTPRR